MGNFRMEWSNLGIHEDSIIKIKGIELISEKKVEEGAYKIWKAHAFDDSIFRVSACYIINVILFHYYHSNS